MVTLSFWVSLLITMHGKCRNLKRGYKGAKRTVGPALRERAQANWVLLRSEAEDSN